TQVSVTAQSGQSSRSRDRATLSNRALLPTDEPVTSPTRSPPSAVVAAALPTAVDVLAVAMTFSPSQHTLSAIALLQLNDRSVRFDPNWVLVLLARLKILRTADVEPLQTTS